MLQVWALWLLIRAARAAEAKAIPAAPHERDQVAGVRQLRVGRDERLACDSGISAQRENVGHPFTLHPVEDLARPVRRVGAREVRHRLDVVLALDARDELERLLPRS